MTDSTQPTEKTSATGTTPATREAPSAREPTVWLNGRFVPLSAATVPITDRSFLSGDGIFETLRLTRGSPFALRRHLDRLEQSAHVTGIAIPPRETLAQAALQVGAANRRYTGDSGRMRITVSAGQVGPAATRTGTRQTVVITAEAQPAHPAAIDMVTSPFTVNDRSPTQGAKTTSYAESIANLRWAQSSGAAEALLFNGQGQLVEACTANVAVRLSHQWLTPFLSVGCLPGITRALACEWNLIEEAPLTKSDVARAESIVIMSSTRGLLPARSLDGQPLALGDDVVALTTRFDEMCSLSNDP